MTSRAPVVAGSLLAANFACLARDLGRLEQAGVPWLHLDCMDGHFVPNLTFGPEVLAALRRAGCKLSLDTHLMLDEPMAGVNPALRQALLEVLRDHHVAAQVAGDQLIGHFAPVMGKRHVEVAGAGKGGGQRLR